MNNNITPDINDTYTSAELEQLGFRLGERLVLRDGREFVLSETNEDLVAASLVAPIVATGSIRYYHANAPITGSDELDTVEPFILITNAGATVAAGALAGLTIVVQNDSNGGTLIGKIKGNTAGASSATNLFKIFLEKPLQAALTALPSVEVFDPNYVAYADVDETRFANGVAIVAVDQSEAPYFWRQVCGDAILRDEAGDVAVGLGVKVASTNPGEFVVAVTAKGEYDEHIIGNVLYPSNVARSFALVRLNRLS